MNTIENNRLIAEFLGYVNTTPTDKDFNIYELKNGVLGDMLEAMSMKFHSDWNWLMLVVDKIESLNLGTKTIETVFNEKDTFFNANVTFKIEYKDCYIDFYGDMKVYEKWVKITQYGSKIEATYNACIQFVKWYNENKNN